MQKYGKSRNIDVSGENIPLFFSIPHKFFATLFSAMGHPIFSFFGGK